MPARMHLAVGFGGIVDPRRLDDRQRVHIGAQTHHAAGSIGFAMDHANHPGAANAFDNLVTAKRPQQIGHLAGGALHIEQQFGMFVKIMPPRGDFGQKVSKTVFDGHRMAPWLAPA